MTTERATDAASCVPKAHSPEPSGEIGVNESIQQRRAQGASSERGHHEAHSPKPAGGRPHKRWRIRVIKINAGKYPEFACDKEHPFARMALEARIEEFDSFFARLWARMKTVKPEAGCLLAAA